MRLFKTRIGNWRSARIESMAIRSLVIAMMVVFGLVAKASAQEDTNSFVQKTIDAAQLKMAKIYGAGAGNVDGFATGIVVSDDGKVLTTQGVILDGKRVRVVLADGSSHIATILKRDRIRQIALLKIQAETPNFYELSDKPVGEKGDWVFALSNAFKVADKEEPVSATLGIISLRTTIEARLTKRDVAYKGEMVLIDAITSNPGAAGGAVVKADGNLVGMIGKVISSSETNTRLNYAVPSSALLAFVEGKENSVEDAKEPTAEVAKNAELGIVLFKFGGRSNPAYIDRVRRGSPAATAKLKTDDMIIAIAGNKIGSVRDYNSTVETLRPDEEILMIVKRGVEILRIRITPTAKK